jgi:hypothetical protein
VAPSISTVREPDATFSDPRQAVLYDVFNNDRSDLEAYVRIAAEVAAHRVVDVGCGIFFVGHGRA